MKRKPLLTGEAIFKENHKSNLDNGDAPMKYENRITWNFSKIIIFCK